MTNEDALNILERHIECDNDNCPEPGMSCSECPYNVDAIDYARARKMAIEALSKQCASGGQPVTNGHALDKGIIVDFVAFQREWLKTHKIMELNSADEVMTEIFLKETGKAFIDSLGQSVKNDEAIRTDDHIADDSKMVKLQKRTIIERLIIAQSLIEGVIFDSSNQFRDTTKKTEDVPDTNVGKTDFKPGDKFILELSEERSIYDDFRIKGTDSYVGTYLLKKLKRYGPEVNATTDKIMIELAEAIETVKFECGEWKGLAQTIVNGLKKLPPKQSEKIPYKKPELYEIHQDHTDCIWYHYLDDDEPNACPSTCSQYRDGWNDAMNYIFRDGKGYQPYKRKAK